MTGPKHDTEPTGDLPPADTTRWVAKRKAQVVAAVRSGVITLDEACRRYALTVDEFLGWQASVDSHGMDGLKTTHIQRFRVPAVTA